MAEVMSGPAPYRKTPDDTLLCPECLLSNDTTARYCDQCSRQLTEQGADYEPRPGDIVRCSHCPAANQPDATYCDQCGGRLSHAAYVAAQAAATSSAGRQPMTSAAERAVELLARAHGVPAGDLKRAVADVLRMPPVSSSAGKPATSSRGKQVMTPQERTAHLDAMALRGQRQRALELAPLTGDTLRDAAAAADRAAEIESLWEALDDEARRQQSELGSWPDPAAVAACRQAEADADAAWQARQAAVAQRDVLAARLDGRTPGQDEAESERFYRMLDARRAQRDRRPW